MDGVDGGHPRRSRDDRHPPDRHLGPTPAELAAAPPGNFGGSDQPPRGRKVVPLTNLELTTAFLAHEDQINLLQHQMAMVYKFSQSLDFAQILLDAVKEWQKAHKPGVAHPEGACSTSVAKALLLEMTRARTPSTVDRDTYHGLQSLAASAQQPRIERTHCE